MAITSGLFNSINGDRRYDAKWFALYFSTFIGNGVFPNPSSGLQVIENTNMKTVVKSGQGWINGYFIVNDNDYILTHDIADGVLKRIDRVVMRLNYITRRIECVIKKGVFASAPVAPILQRDADVYELALADVFINNGATVISQANITDTRLNKSLCGIVHGTVDQVDTTTLFNQYQSWMTQQQAKYESETAIWTAQKQLEFDQWQTQEKTDFDAWFLTIKDILDGNVAANLQNQIMQLDTRVTVVENKVTSHKADYVKHPAFAITAGTATAYTVTLDPVPVSVGEGFGITIVPHILNGTNPTLNVNGLGAIALKDQKGVAFKVGKLLVGMSYSFRKVGTSFLADSGSEGGGNLQPNQALAGLTFTNDNGEQIGLGDSNLIPSNVKSGVSLFGVLGAFKGSSPGDFQLYGRAKKPYHTSPIPKALMGFTIGSAGYYRFSSQVRPSAGNKYQVYVNGIPAGELREYTSNLGLFTVIDDLEAPDNANVIMYGWGPVNITMDGMNISQKLSFSDYI